MELFIACLGVGLPGFLGRFDLGGLDVLVASFDAFFLLIKVELYLCKHLLRAVFLGIDLGLACIELHIDDGPLTFLCLLLNKGKVVCLLPRILAPGAFGFVGLFLPVLLRALGVLIFMRGQRRVELTDLTVIVFPFL